jgi:hypothetical protein
MSIEQPDELADREHDLMRALHMPMSAEAQKVAMFDEMVSMLDKCATTYAEFSGYFYITGKSNMETAARIACEASSELVDRARAIK